MTKRTPTSIEELKFLLYGRECENKDFIRNINLINSIVADMTDNHFKCEEKYNNDEILICQKILNEKSYLYPDTKREWITKTKPGTFYKRFVIFYEYKSGERDFEILVNEYNKNKTAVLYKHIDGRYVFTVKDTTGKETYLEPQDEDFNIYKLHIGQFNKSIRLLGFIAIEN